MNDPPQSTLPFALHEARGREDLVVGRANAGAVDWIDRWPDWQPPGLILSGPAGCGKSHLGAVWCRRSEAPLYPATELQAAVDAVRHGAAALLVEDLDESPDEQGLFHLVTAMQEAGGHLLLTCRRPPAQLGLRLADLESRLRAMHSAFLQEPDDALLCDVMRKLFRDRGVRVETDVILFLVRRMQRSFAAARRLVEELDAAALARRRKLTIPFVRAWFANVANPHA